MKESNKMIINIIHDIIWTYYECVNTRISVENNVSVESNTMKNRSSN